MCWIVTEQAHADAEVTFLKIENHLNFVTLKGLISKNAKLIKYWRFAMSADQTHNPKTSLFDKLGLRLRSQLS